MRWMLRLAMVGVLAIGGSSGQEKATVKEKDKEELFSLPSGDVGKLLAKELPPPARPGTLHQPGRAAPTPAPMPRLLTMAESLPPAVVGRTPLPPTARKRPLLPSFAAEERLGVAPTALPAEPSFATGKLTRVEAEDVSIPPPLAPMALPVPDRVPVEDATADTSTAAVLLAPLPRRESPVPFVRERVPEPFERRVEHPGMVDEWLVPFR